MNLHAIEQKQLRGRRRVDGMGRPKFDFHTGGRDLVAMGHMKCGQPPDVRDCRPDDVAARLHTECAGWNEKDPLKRFTDEHRMKVLDEVVDRGVHICTKQGSDEVIRASRVRRRLLGLP